MPSAQPAPVFQLRITLQGIEPPIWRLVELPATSSLEALDVVIESAMGWTFSHLHGFTVRSGKSLRRRRSIEEHEEPYVRIDEVMKKQGDAIEYVYDFGDDWTHDVKLENVLDSSTSDSSPRCIAGERACPPEDIGGVYGYMDLLEALATPANELDEEVIWFGLEEFDSEAFDLEQTNERLSRIPAHSMRAKKRPGRPSRPNALSPAQSAREPILPASPREMERSMRGIQQALDGLEFDTMEEAQEYLETLIAAGEPILDPEPGDDPASRAQHLADLAFDAPTEDEAVKLAREALSIYPDCADAYVVLAETAKSPEEAHNYYDLGVRAGERALGPQAFKEFAGMFWGRVETRPYMRARLGLALTEWALGDWDTAVEHLGEMLVLNPNDNQGVRYHVARCMLELGADEALEELLDAYSEDASAHWLYTRALTLFRLDGESPEAVHALDEALREYPQIAALLLNLKKLPLVLRAEIDFDDAHEAAAYAALYDDIWRNSNGALRWLRNRVKHTDPALSRKVER